MPTSSPAVVLHLAPPQPRFPSLTTVDLDALTAKQFVGTLASQGQPPRPQLLVDCGALQALRRLGIGHMVAELLVLRRSGAQVWLRNIGPVLRQCLHVLRLDQLFLLAS